jgi:hypothetical protein
MQGGLSGDVAPHEYGVTATGTGQPSTMSTDSADQPMVAAWLPGSLTNDDVLFFGAVINAFAALAWLLAVATGVIW